MLKYHSELAGGLISWGGINSDGVLSMIALSVNWPMFASCISVDSCWLSQQEKRRRDLWTVTDTV